MKNINTWFSDKTTPKEQDTPTDEIYLDHSANSIAELQEALISANQTLKEKAEAFAKKEEEFRQKEDSFRQLEEACRLKEEACRLKEEEFRQKEDACRQKEEEFRQMEVDLTAREKICIEKEKEFGERPGLIARIEKIESAIGDSSHKDRIIRELHDDLQKKNRNFYAELTRPAIKSIIRIHDFVAGTLKAATRKEGEDSEAALQRLRQAVEGNCLMIEDLLNDEFNIILFSPEKGDSYLPKEHTAVISVDTDDPALAGTIQECRQPGFKELESGRLVKSAVVAVYKMKRK